MEPNRKKGEFAVVIADKYQEKGLGTKLVDMLINVAEEKGLESIYGIIMPGQCGDAEPMREAGFHR